MHAPALDAVDAWAYVQPDPKPSRPEAIRRLVSIGLTASSSAPSLDQRIARQEQKLARKIPAKASPEKGMAVLRKGLAEVEHRKLVAKKKASGRKRAADPAGESRPAHAPGRKASRRPKA